MKKIFAGIWAVMLFISIAASLCHARTAYVSDMLILTFREGPGTSYPVLKSLKSNTPVTIIEESNGYLKVELTSGEQGWVDEKFIMTETPKTLIIAQLNREKATLEKKIEALTGDSDQYKIELESQKKAAEDRVDALTEQLEQSKKENHALSKTLKKLETDFSALKTASADVTGTLKENKRLKAENKTLSDTIEQLENDTRHMFRTGMIKWFLAGVGVLLLGWIFGHSMSSKRRQSSSLLD